MWFKTQYHLLSKIKKTRNGHGEHGGCDSKHNITYCLRKRKQEMDMVSIRMWFKTQYHLLSKKKKTRNGHGEHAGCDSKHNITYYLRKRKQEMDMVNMQDVIQNTISLTS